MPVRTLTSQQNEELAERNMDLLLNLTQSATTPLYAVLSPDGGLIDQLGGVKEPQVFKEFLTRALEKLPKHAEVVQTGSHPTIPGHSRLRNWGDDRRKSRGGRIYCCRTPYRIDADHAVGVGATRSWAAKGSQPSRARPG